MTMKFNIQNIKDNYDNLNKMINKNNDEFLISLSIYEMAQVDKSYITEDFVNDIYNAIQKQDYFYSEDIRDAIDDVKDNIEKQKLENVIDNYCENCTNQEWKDLLYLYCIEDKEDYMGKVRKELNEEIMSEFESLNSEERDQKINFFSKYKNKEIEKDIEEEMEK